MTTPARPLSLVTGASAGIGAAFADALAARGHDLVLVARRAERLHRLGDALHAKYGTTISVLPADLADPAAPARLCEALAQRELAVDWLINNAGYGVPGRFLSSDWKTHADFLQVLVTSVCELTHRFLPGMEAAGHGRVLNIASLAGLVPASAGHTLYGAAKAFVIRFSESLAQETAPRGVHVTALCPGMTFTEFHDVNNMRERVSKLPAWLWQDAATVARLGVDAVERGDARCVPGGVNRMLAGLSKYLPEPAARALIASRSRDFRDAN